MIRFTGIAASEVRSWHDGSYMHFALASNLASVIRVTAAAVSRDHADPRVIGKPGLDGGNLPVGQKRRYPSAFQIANEGLVAMIAAPGPIIDADDIQRLSRQFRSRRTTLSRVSLLTGILNRCEVGGRPPNANPR
jgi:hypothetical protein